MSKIRGHMIDSEPFISLKDLLLAIYAQINDPKISASSKQGLNVLAATLTTMFKDEL